MPKLSSLTITLVAAGALLAGGAYSYAQTTQPSQTSPAKTQSSKPKTATTTKPHTATTAKSATTLTTQKEKFSYALGMDLGTNIGTTLKKQSVDFDPAIMSQGMKDGLAGGKTLITEEEAKAVLAEMQKQVQGQMQAKQQAQAEENKKAGDAFLAANKSKEGIVTLPSGLQYKILQAGTGPKPLATDTVVCNYKGTLIDGTEFDSSYKRGQPATFPLNQVIKGWTEALQLMPVGSKWQLFLPPDLAYGEHAPPEIGPNATLVFEVELLSIQKKDAGQKPGDNPASKPQ